MNKKRFALLIMISVLVLVTLIGGCAKNNDDNISALINELKENTDYDVQYNKEKGTIRIMDYISKDTIIKAVSKDNVYNQWKEMRNELNGVYNDLFELGKSKGIKDISYEVIIIDKESANTDKEVPLLIINDEGVVFDMVEEIKSK